MPSSRIVPAVDPAGPLDPGLQLSPEELAARAAEPPPPPSRRFVLGTAGLIMLGAGGGVGYSFWRTRHGAARVAPMALRQAAVAERDLVASLDRAIARFPDQRALLDQLRADHAAHAAALDAAVRAHTGHLPRHPAPVAATGHLIDTERAASAAAARRAAALTGADAALLASIAACEASHVELLT
jgi:hypothetical protein